MHERCPFINECISICCRYAFTPLIDDSDDEEIEEFSASANLCTATAGGFFIVSIVQKVLAVIDVLKHFLQLKAWS